MHPLTPDFVAAALTQLRRVQPDVFGSDSHCFELNPVTSEKRVAEFEKEFSIQLPRDYRDFITGIGNGGAGPFYGVFPLGEVDENFGLRRWQKDDGLVGVLSKPFPHEREWNDVSSMPPDDLLDRDESQYNSQMEVFAEMYYSSSLVNGAIPICHQGCALRVWLVVNGTQAGYLWDDRRSENGGLKPLRLPNDSPATFGSWYENWINSCLAALQT